MAQAAIFDGFMEAYGNYLKKVVFCHIFYFAELMALNILLKILFLLSSPGLQQMTSTSY